ncbi:MAG: hypothetical protein ABIA63_07885, partial [bacterium]
MNILIIFLICGALEFGPEIQPPENIRIIYSEKNLEIHWDPVPGAWGYNIYTSNAANAKKVQKRLVNRTAITSGNRFIYFWDVINGKMERRIKGYEHHICVTAVLKKPGLKVESDYSPEADNCYFNGYKNVTSRSIIKNIIIKMQKSDYMPVNKRINSLKKFTDFMEGPGNKLFKIIKDSLDATEVGACAPISTILVQLMKKHGIFAYKIEGNFIKEYHAFVALNIEDVEYILDFTANQFVPDVAPVFFPRDYSYLNEKGRLSTQGIPV